MLNELMIIAAILFAVAGGMVFFAVLGSLAACLLSSRISREEESREPEHFCTCGEPVNGPGEFCCGICAATDSARRDHAK